MSAGETDEPVTCDIKRLIRLPMSLHAKTGFKVQKISFDKLLDFEPLRDAIVFSDDLVDIELIQDIKYVINDTSFDLKKGDNKVPRYLK